MADSRETGQWFAGPSDMPHRLMLIEAAQANADTSVAALLAANAFSLERTDWQGLLREDVHRSRAHAIVAVAGAERDRPLSFFQWLRAHPIPLPTLAVLPQKSDEELLHTALRATDDFSLWPTAQEELCHRVRRLLGPEPGGVESVRARLTEERGLSQLLGNHPTFTRVVEQLPSIARSEAPVLITGETGTGKELFARAIHFLGPRANLPFIAVDCGVLPDHLMENEVFGHVRGAYTDAHRDQRGLVAMAEGGTLFLDEIDSLSLAAQAKLLRFLQERTFRPLGSDRFVQADVNVIVATNNDLDACVADKRFRADLYFRLNVLPLHLPPLRERYGDIGLLARHFLDERLKAGGPSRKSFSAAALQRLALHDWPGNVRELINVVQRAMLAADGAQILPCHILLSASPPAPGSVIGSFKQARAGAVAAFERAYVEELLRRHHGNVTQAARDAQKDRRAFGRLLKKYRIDRRTL